MRMGLLLPSQDKTTSRSERKLLIQRNLFVQLEFNSPSSAHADWVFTFFSMRFTCLACQVQFKSADEQRDHYHTDWHRYNLKRKVAELPPVSAENFAQRIRGKCEIALFALFVCLAKFHFHLRCY